MRGDDAQVQCHERAPSVREIILEPTWKRRRASLLGVRRPFYFLSRASCQCSSKKPASTTKPGALSLGGVRRSIIAQSGSLGVCCEFVCELPSRKVKLLLRTT